MVFKNTVLNILVGDFPVQAVTRSPSTPGVPSSRLGHAMWVSKWTNRSQGRFFLEVSPVFPCQKFHSTIYPHSSNSFHLIYLYDGATGFIGRHPCYSQTFNTGSSSHLIHRPGPVAYTSCEARNIYICLLRSVVINFQITGQKFRALIIIFQEYVKTTQTFVVKSS